MPQYLIKMSVPIDGEDEADVLKKFREWLANVDEPFRPFVTLVPDTDVAERLLGGTEKEPVVVGFDMEALEWLHRQESEFMQPQVEQFDTADLDCGIEEVGWYCRLSAPGYLDCTEWSGPFETELDAILNLYEMYGD